MCISSSEDAQPIGNPAQKIDSDGDGWSDDQESLAGTDPFDKDTDGDGYWDPIDPNALVSNKKSANSVKGSIEDCNSTDCENYGSGDCGAFNENCTGDCANCTGCDGNCGIVVITNPSTTPVPVTPIPTTTVAPTSTPSATVPPITMPSQQKSLDIYHFYGNRGCEACPELSSYAVETLTTFFSDEYGGGTITFQSYSYADSGNGELIERFNVYSASVFVVENVNGIETIHNPSPTLWEYIHDKDSYMEFFKGYLENLL